MKLFILAAVIAVLLAGCLATGSRPIATEDHVDLDRFMGRWYVIANIPTPFERNVYNAVEHYELDERGRVHTTFTYRDGGFDEPVETMTPTGFVRDGTGNAVWGMQFIWPFRAEYRVLHVDDDYEVTIIGRTRRDYAWIMARQPEIDEDDLQQLIDRLDDAGYDVSGVRIVPQQWPAGDGSAAVDSVLEAGA